MITYWLESERKGSHSQYKPLGEIDKMSSQNLSMPSDQSNQPANSNPPDYLDYSFGGKGQPMANVEA